ncbi:MAG: hypothetical protein FJ224_06360 [Lentisphaerae bacterium]|nr:hypothetical protein [Lentisphaerota bacterium]
MSLEILLKYPVVLLAGFLTTWLLTPAAMALSNRFGLMDQPGGRHIHKSPIPRGGGIAVFAGMHAVCAAVFLLPWSSFQATLSHEWWGRFAIVSSLVFLLGLADDLRGLKPVTKLAGQAAIALLAFSLGFRAGNMLGFGLPLIMDIAVTVLWFVTICNAFNLIDGMDGLAAGLGAIAGLGLAGWLVLRRLPGDVLITFGLIGPCLAFLRYNFHPARCFLGDSGSLTIGFAVAAISISTGSKGMTMAAILVPLLAAGIPLLDSMLAIWRRTARGMAAGPSSGGHAGVMTADSDHLHHRLLRSFGSQPATAGRLYAGAITLVAVGLLSMLFHAKAMGIYVVAFVAAVYVVVKHIARTEIAASGAAVLVGLRRPTRSAVLLMLYPGWDAASLAASFSLALYLAGEFLTMESYKEAWFGQVPLWVGLPMVALVLTRSYSKIWSRARMSEFLQAAVYVAVGLLVAAALTNIVNEVPARSLAIQFLSCLALSEFGILLRRAVPQAVTEADWSRAASSGAETGAERVLIYGAGGEGWLYLRSLDPHSNPEAARRHVVGFIDDDPALQDRYIGGFRVFGGSDRIVEIVRSENVTHIVLTRDPGPAGKARAEDAAKATGAIARVWRSSEDPMGAAPP